MAHASVATGDSLPPLNSPNLHKLGSSTDDRNDLVRSFIRAQEAHIASYALEGKSVSASWRTSPGPSKDRSKKDARDVEIASGFGTPILKPRNRRAPEAPDMEESNQDTRRKKKAKHMGSDAEPSVAEVEPVKSKERRTNEPHDDTTSKKQTNSKRGHRNKDKPVPAEGNKKRSREPEIDEEHFGRLAERRERRRAKKAIVDPKPKPAASESDEEETLANRRHDTKHASKKGKKNKGPKMPAGLALMHGFSATNVGKNRLTLRPDPVVGVFNKGKASAKTTVKAKATKPSLMLFSEQRFLSKARVEQKSSKSSSDHVSTCASDDPPVPKGASKQQKNFPKSSRKKRKRAPSPSNRSTSSREDDVPSSSPKPKHSPAKKRQKPPRAESPVWDIEHDDAKLSDVASDTSAPSGDDKKADEGTVVLDTRTVQPKWAAALQERQPDPPSCTKEVDPPRADRSDKSDTSSIAPSNSASQAALRRICGDGAGTPSVTATFSKYFRAPEPTPVPAPDGFGSVVSYKSASPAAGLGIAHSLGQAEAPGVMSALDIPPEAAFMDPRAHSPQLHFGPSGVAPVQASSPALLARSVSAGAGSSPLRSPGSPLGFLPGLPSPAFSRLPSLPLEAGPDYTAYEAPPVPQYARADESHRRSRRHRKQKRRAHRDLGYSPRADDFDHGLLPESLGPYTEDSTAMEVDDWDRHASIADVDYGDSPQPAFVSDFPGRVQYEEVEEVETDDLGIYRGYYAGDLLDGAPEYTVEALPESYDVPVEYGRGGEWAEGCFAEGSHSAVRGATYLGDIDPQARLDDFVEADDRYLDPDNAQAFGAEGICYESPDVDVSAAEVDEESALAVQYSDDEDALDSDSALEEGRSMLGSLQRFSQGRALLMGVSEVGLGGSNASGTGGHYHGHGRAGGSTARMEEDVARSLKGHWQPQRF
ncbi:hypothetical protein OH77DRAFT_1591835 [Trametes cingulata]|nr:hypothetical protein OH77DRAFT_1591835 [Trametes cingulata]